mmetsp:Transcript_7952/g.26045  ORF Transcript_7952/g.26045 Transcript_7952/m.26045 type:complete len:236 (+) Transcript_7952:214-921(+)
MASSRCRALPHSFGQLGSMFVTRFMTSAPEPAGLWCSLRWSGLASALLASSWRPHATMWPAPPSRASSSLTGARRGSVTSSPPAATMRQSSSWQGCSLMTPSCGGLRPSSQICQSSGRSPRSAAFRRTRRLAWLERASRSVPPSRGSRARGATRRFPIFEEVPCVLASLVPDGLTEELLPMGLDISLAVPEFQKSEIGKLLPDAWYGSSEPCRTGYIYIPVGCARILTDSVNGRL